MLRLLVASAIILFAASGASRSESQQPSIGEGGQPEQQPTQPQQTSDTPKYGTDQVPFVVKILPTQESNEKASQDTKDREAKSELDRKLVDFNGDLAYYTKLLAYVAGFQFLALIGQVIFLRLAFKESKRAGDIARDAMIAGGRAFIFATGYNALWEIELDY